MSVNVPLLPYQKASLTSESAETLLLGGIGSGKSHVGAWACIHMIMKYPGIDILMGANTYTQLITASVKTLMLILDEYHIPYQATLSGARKRIEIGKSTIYLYSLEKYDNIRGIEVGFCWLDEICFSKKEALDVIRGRMRGKIGTRQILMTSSPNGFNWCYDLFEGQDDPEAVGYENYRLIRALTKQNTYLPAGYYEMLLEAYGGEDSDLAKQELFGQFVNLQEGAIYNMFDRKLNVRECKLNKDHPVYVGVDFNVDNMSATYIQYINGIFYQCTEVKLTHRNANTHDLSARIIKDLKGYNVKLIADSTGNARKTSNSAQSDHQILKDAGLYLMPTKNPLIRDRQINLNTMFRKEKFVIDPSCKETIREIETLSARDKEGNVSHLSVTSGYVGWKLDPMFDKYAKGTVTKL